MKDFNQKFNISVLKVKRYNKARLDELVELLLIGTS